MEFVVRSWNQALHPHCCPRPPRVMHMTFATSNGYRDYLHDAKTPTKFLEASSIRVVHATHMLLEVQKFDTWKPNRLEHMKTSALFDHCKDLKMNLIHDKWTCSLKMIWTWWVSLIDSGDIKPWRESYHAGLRVFWFEVGHVMDEDFKRQANPSRGRQHNGAPLSFRGGQLKLRCSSLFSKPR